MLTLVELAIKLSWEIMLTAGFELDVLRRKRPYRWTIWVRLDIVQDLTTISTEVVIRWNPLHRITCLWQHVHLSRRPRCALSRKASAALRFRAEIVINVHLFTLVVHKNGLCKGAAKITHSLQLNETLTPQAFGYASWASASLIIGLRVQVIPLALARVH